MAHSAYTWRIGKKARRHACVRGGDYRKLYAASEPVAVTPITL
jgi:hypothetical protein